MFERLHLFGDRARALNGIARDYLFLSDYPSALQYCLEGLKCARLAGSRSTEAMLLHVLAEIKMALGTFEEARQDICACTQLYEELGDNSGVAPALGLHALILSSMENNAEAITLLQRSLALNEALRLPIGAVYCHLNLAALYYKVHDSRAKEHAVTALEISEKYRIRS